MQLPKILIVDDELNHLETIVDIVEELGNAYVILQAFNGEIAFKIAEKEIPDLIITDWEMPIMNGIDLIKSLKNNPKTSEIPVIMCTGVMTSAKNLATALNAGALDYIRKPIDKIELIARISSMLKLSDSYKKIKEQNIQLEQQKEEITIRNKKIEEQNHILSEINIGKDKFFSILAHDLKSPFNSMLGLSDLLNDEFASFDLEKQKEFINIINKGLHSTYNLLDNLLLWSYAQRGTIDFKPTNENLYLLANDFVAVLMLAANNKSIQLINEIPKDIFITADKNMLSTIIRNLVSNAIKFTHREGEIVINARKISDENNQNFIEIFVKDNGLGVPIEIQPKLFDISKNTSLLGTENEKGSGFGLNLCKEFVEKHGGKIWLKSEFGVGSEFLFTIPVYQ